MTESEGPMNHYLLTPSGVTTIEEGQEHFIDSMARRRRIFRKQLVIREDGTTLREPPRPKHSKNHPSVRGSTAVLDQAAPYDWENDDMYANGPDYPLKTLLLDIGLIVVVACIVLYALMTAY